MPTLEKALEIACHAHAGQLDKANEPYILHVMRVVLGVKSPKARRVAAVHDVREDCKDAKIIAALVHELDDEERTALSAITRRDGETYRNYILRVAANQIATEVKLADLYDNLDRSRISNPTEKDEARWRKYEEARSVLISLQSQR